VERDDDFDLDDEFVDSDEEEHNYERFLESGRRARSGAAKKGKAAWSKLEDVLAERRLQKELRDFDYE